MPLGELRGVVHCENDWGRRRGGVAKRRHVAVPAKYAGLKSCNINRHRLARCENNMLSLSAASKRPKTLNIWYVWLLRPSSSAIASPGREAALLRGTHAADKHQAAWLRG